MIVTDRKPVAQKTYKTGLKAQCFCQVRMKDALGSGGTQQPESVGEFLRSRSKMFIAHKTVNLVPKMSRLGTEEELEVVSQANSVEL